MTAIGLVRMAWAGAIVAAVSGFLYLGFAPIPRQYSTDRLLTIGVALLGAITGAVLEHKLERSIRARRSEELTPRLEPDTHSLERLTARGS